MKIRILGSASRDLIEGYSFYERQAEGVGSYFLIRYNSGSVSFLPNSFKPMRWDTRGG
jgi:hypothetical protein